MGVGPAGASRSPHFYEEFERKADIVKRAASEAWAHNHIKQVQTTWRDMRREIFIVNSRGIEEEDLRIDSVMLVLVIAEKNGLVQTGYEPAGFFFNDTATTEIYTLSLHDALPISRSA